MKKTLLSLLIVFVLLAVFMPPRIAARTADFTPSADTLNALGLFLGTPTGYHLDRDMTRAEAGAMVVRLLGKEAEAKELHYPHPFLDVPPWADDYIGYLFHFDVTKGTSAARFGANDKITPAQYAAFMLRALSYDDGEGDFQWQKSLEKMRDLGILASAEATAFGSTATLPRGVAVALSIAAVMAHSKDSYYSLLHRLYSDRALTREQLSNAAQKDITVAQEAAMLGVPRTDVGSGSVLNSEEVYQKTSPAVFYIELFESAGDRENDHPYSSGSGFFITGDGVAVTSFHVIDDAAYARVTMSNGSTFDVDRVLAFSEEEDIAVVRVKGGKFPFLSLGDPAKLRPAQVIYCMGSPYGFADTISNGLVSTSPIKSYPQIDNREFIQISVPISSGSSGGPLINEFGEVVGITTIVTSGQNLNFAIPVSVLSKLTYLDPPASLTRIAVESAWSWTTDPEERMVEIEPNDAKPAQTLPDEGEFLGGVRNIHDVDLYGIKANTSKEFFLTWRTKEISHRNHIRVEVIDLQTGAVAIAPRLVEEIPYLYVHGHLKKGGQYALRVMTDGAPAVLWDDTPYEFIYYIEDSPISPTSPDDYIIRETEPNDTFETSQYLPFGYTAWGSLPRNDKDFYGFTLETSASVSLMIWPWSGFSVKAELYDSAKQLIATLAPTDWDIFKANTRALSAGAYFVRISNDNDDAVVDEDDVFEKKYDLYVGELDSSYATNW